MTPKTVNVVLTGDKNYVYPMGVLITSIAENLSKNTKLRVFLFVQGFDENDKAELNKLLLQYNFLNIVYVDMDKYLHYFKECDVSTFRLQYISLATYFRLLMFKILPDDVDWCFYIDGDMTIDTDLAKLQSEIPENKLFAGVMEVFAMTERKTILAHLLKMTDFSKFAKNPFEAPYFNAGFFLANIGKLRKINIFDKMMDFLRRYPNPVYADQDTLNATIGQMYNKDIVLLDPAYNVFCNISYRKDFESPIYSAKQVKEAFKKPKIYHFVGWEKPWKVKTQHFFDVWWKYAKKSPFYNVLKKSKPKVYQKQEKYLVLSIPLLCVNYTSNRKKFYLLSLINILTVRLSRHKRSYWLFNAVPVLSIYKR